MYEIICFTDDSDNSDSRLMCRICDIIGPVQRRDAGIADIIVEFRKRSGLTRFDKCFLPDFEMNAVLTFGNMYGASCTSRSGNTGGNQKEIFVVEFYCTGIENTVRTRKIVFRQNGVAFITTNQICKLHVHDSLWKSLSILFCIEISVVFCCSFVY